jgi:hypothetical protein
MNKEPEYIELHGTKYLIGCHPYHWHEDYYREDHPPTIIYADGGRVWHDRNGNLHRLHGEPAAIYADGTKKWAIAGKFCRPDGLPAIEWSNGRKEWYVLKHIGRVPIHSTVKWGESTRIRIEYEDGSIWMAPPPEIFQEKL